MSASQVQVEFYSIHIAPDGDSGPETWRIAATVEVSGLGAGATTVGSDATVEVRPDQTLMLNRQISQNVSRGVGLIARLEARDDASGDLVGSIQWLLRLPIEHHYDLWTTASGERFNGRLRVNITALAPQGQWMQVGDRPTIRPHHDSGDFTTLPEADERFVRVCPVIPIPGGSLPPIPSAVARLSQGVVVDLNINQYELDLSREDLGLQLNKLVNPAVIPVIDASDSDIEDKCARLRITEYRPQDLDMDQVYWCVASGSVRFRVGGASRQTAQGGEVKAYGTLSGGEDEQCRIELRWGSDSGPVLTVYRAWVGRVTYASCRANIIQCTAADARNPPFAGLGPDERILRIRQQLAVANLLLWQAGMHLLFDRDATAYEGATRLAEGIFLVPHRDNYTFNVARTPRCVASLLNARRRVLNIAYIHSVATDAGESQPAGATTDRGMGLAEPAGEDSMDGVPSTSWVRPSGFPGDEPAATVSMRRGETSTGRRNIRDLPASLRSGFSRLAHGQTMDGVWAFCMTLQAQGISSLLEGAEVTIPDALMVLTGGQILTHETGHALGLHHRGSGGRRSEEEGSDDRVNHQAGPQSGHGHPFNENLMSYGGAEASQDIDMIQCQVIRRNALLRDQP